MKLHIGNKSYSSWSLRPWLLLTQAGIPFEEHVIPLDQPSSSADIAAVSGAGRVPVLEDGGLTVWDSLAICEYLAERFPAAGVWPQERRARARARSLCAEMHAGFSALRSHCPMNIEAVLPDVGRRVLAEQPGLGPLVSGQPGVARHGGGEGVGRIDQRVNALAP